MPYPHRGYPVSSNGLSPIRRCIELRQRALLYERKRPPLMPLWEQLIDGWITKLSRGPQTPLRWWQGDSGAIEVGSREYVIRAGHIVAMRRSEP